MILFEEKQRRSSDPINTGESIIEFLDRSNFDWAKDVRIYLNTWISKYPEEEAEELINRMKIEFKSPYFELFLHELMINLGFKVSIHPNLIDVNTKPDFLVKSLEKEFYLEARLVTEVTDVERKIENQYQFVVDEINKRVKSNSFFLSLINLEIKSKKQKSLKEFCRRLQTFIDVNDPDKIAEELKLNRNIGKFTYENEFIKITVRIIPRAPEFRNIKTNRVIGILIDGQGRLIDTGNSIVKRIEKKSGRYGDIDKPLIIGLNVTSPFGIDWRLIVDSLYGDFENNIRVKRNGLFGSIEKPKHTRISGILISDIHYLTVNKAKIKYFKNPYSINPFTFDGKLDEVYLDGNNIYDLAGMPLQDWIIN